MEHRTSTIGRLVRRHGWIVFIGLVVGAVAGGVALAQSDPVYSSAASVLVQPVSAAEVNLETEAQVARSTETAVDAGARLGGPVPSVASVEVLPNTSVLVIRFEAATPAAAQAGARAFAEVYLHNRAESANAAIAEQVRAVTAKIAELDDESADLNRRIAAVPPDSPDLGGLQTTLATVTAQSTALRTRANDLATTTVNPGRVIGEPERPSSPVRPVGWFFVGVGAAAGSVLALFVTLVRDVLSRRVRHGTDVAARAGIAVLAELPGETTDANASGTMPARVLAPHHPCGRAFHRLRNEVVATLQPDDHTILVTSASPGAASTVVAANLAAALARADNDVILVGANVPDIGSRAITLAQLFDVADIPGLTDVLAGRTPLSGAVQRAARTPRLRIVTPGGTASAGGLLQSEAVRSTLQVLGNRARYLVIEAPSAASGADAQSLAGAANVAILVVEAGQARHAQVADAAIQLKRVGTRLLGAVVVPHLVTGEPDEERFRGMHRAEDVDGLPTDVWLNDPRSAMNGPTTAVAQIEPTRPTTPAQN
jgi:Mrp family chromosome partitioning ATPase